MKHLLLNSVHEAMIGFNLEVVAVGLCVAAIILFAEVFYREDS